MSKKAVRPCLILHKKSCNRPEVKAAVQQARNENIQLEVMIPWKGKDLRRFVRKALKKGVNRFVAGGGDGTLNAVLNAVLKCEKASRASIGLLPLGTANDFARGNGIDAKDLAVALRHACTGTPTPIDVGRMNGRYFINVASGGFGAEVTATTPRELKSKLGGGAYALMGLVKAANLQPTHSRILLPDGEVEDGKILVMAVGNSRFAGGGFEVAPKADITDGLLDLAALGNPSLAKLGQLIEELKDISGEGRQTFFYRQLKRFVLETDRPFHINLDGEPFVDRRFEFDVLSRGVQVVLGEKKTALSAG